MANYLTIFKLLFKHSLKRSGEKSSKWYFLAYAFIGITFGAMIVFLCLGISTVARSMQNIGVLPEFLALILMIACVAVLLFGLVPMLNQLYFSRDTEFMLSLPVKPGTVFMAKLTMVYLTEIAVSTVMLVPVMLTVGITLKLGAVFYLVSLLAVLTVPAIPMVLISIIAIPLMYIVSFFKSKGALTSIVVIVLFGVVFAGYYFVLDRFTDFMLGAEDMDVDAFVSGFSAAIMTVSKIIFPLTAISRVACLSRLTLFGELSLPAAVAVNSAVYILTAAALVVLAVVISSLVYNRGARSSLESGVKQKAAAAEFTKSGSAVKALIKKEWRELFRTPAFAFQCLGGIVLCPILVVVMSSSFSVGLGAEELAVPIAALTNKITSFALIGFVMMMGVGLNTGAATTISREGGNLWMMKVIPVSYRDVIKAKLTLYLIISSVTVTLSAAVASVMCFDPINLVCGMAFLLVYNYGFNCFCIFTDLSSPKLTWATPNEAVKQNKNALIPMLVNMAVGAIMIVVPIALLIIIPSTLVATIVSWAILFAVAIVSAVVFHLVLFKNCARLFNKLTV